jgi:hypothetical protein
MASELDPLSVHNDSRLGPPLPWALVLAAAISLFSLPVLLIRTPQRWGQRNASTLAACALTWVFAVASLSALILARGAATVPAVAAFVLTIWLWRAGWLGIRLWRF